MQIFEQILDAFILYAEKIPVAIFSFLGAFIEEIIAPIPSPLVMTTVGSVAAAQGKDAAFLLLLAVIGALGKTLGAWVIYFIADKAEDIAARKIGGFFGLSHEKIESIGRRFNKSWKDDIILFLIRIAPVIPSSPVSFVCGLIKINLRTFLVSTFAGTIIRNLFFIYFGYLGLTSAHSLLKGIGAAESFIQTAMVVSAGLFLLWLYWRRRIKK